MYRILGIIRSFRFFILFLILEGISIHIYINFQTSARVILHENIADFKNQIGNQLHGIHEYFYLKTKNEQLIAENIMLRNQLHNTYRMLRTGEEMFNDTLWDNKKNPYLKQYSILGASVIGIDYLYGNNYFHIYRGAKQGVQKNMAVFSDKGIAGVVIYTTDNFSTVLSVLNTNAKVSAKIKNTNFNGYAEWGGQGNELLMKNIPGNYNIQVGDSVVTSHYSDIYIPNLFIGKVSKVELGESKNNYTVYISLGLDMHQLDDVYLIDYKNKNEYNLLKNNIHHINTENDK